eukprot:COSAG06_NODE_1138_length_10565_cov_16.902446_12_plen_82_part_00
MHEASANGDLDTRGVKIFRLGQMGDSLYYFQERPDRWGTGRDCSSAVFCLYFAPALTNSTNDKPNSHSVSLVAASLIPFTL